MRGITGLQGACIPVILLLTEAEEGVVTTVRGFIVVGEEKLGTITVGFSDEITGGELVTVITISY